MSTEEGFSHTFPQHHSASMLTLEYANSMAKTKQERKQRLADLSC